MEELVVNGEKKWEAKLTRGGTFGRGQVGAQWKVVCASEQVVRAHDAQIGHVGGNG